MELKERIRDFAKLGELLGVIGRAEDWPGHSCGLTEQEYQDIDALILAQKHHNGWFIEENVRRAMRSWGENLSVTGLTDWLAPYRPLDWTENTVGVIMAGNIPLVGFHDMLSVLISGKKLLAKPSTDDSHLIRALGGMLIILNAKWADRISWADGRMKDYDAMIATGSDNSARYFKQYFGKVPHVIRKSRSGVAILRGDETDGQLAMLGEDVFGYFGMGCRSVNKVYLPADFDIQRLFQALYTHHDIIDHNKYANNYDYHKAIYLLNEDPIMENGFLLMKEVDGQIASPVATLLYERYGNEGVLREHLAEREEEIQCIISSTDVPFGQAQQPALSDYADGVDTIAFLIALDEGVKTWDMGS